MSDTRQRRTYWSLGTLGEWGAILVTFIFASASLYLQLMPGELLVFQPTEFCVRRGLRAFPSDHLILPIYIENTGNGTKTLELPTLNFSDPATGKDMAFTLRGFIPALDTYSIDETFEVMFGITIPGKSLARYILVFYPVDATNPTTENFMYRFNQRPSSGKIEMRLDYLLNGDPMVHRWKSRQTASDVFLSMPFANAYKDLQLPINIVDFWQYDNLPITTEDVGNYNSVCFPVRNLHGRASD